MKRSLRAAILPPDSRVAISAVEREMGRQMNLTTAYRTRRNTILIRGYCEVPVTEWAGCHRDVDFDAFPVRIGGKIVRTKSGEVVVEIKDHFRIDL